MRCLIPRIPDAGEDRQLVQYINPRYDLRFLPNYLISSVPWCLWNIERYIYKTTKHLGRKLLFRSASILHSLSNMTMTDNSPPPSPNTYKQDCDQASSAADTIILVATSLRRPNQPIPLPLSAVNRNLCYHFPSPPLSNSSSPRSPTSQRTSPVSASSRQGRKHTPNSSRTVSTHGRRRSSLSTCSFHVSQLDQYGPPPHPAPTTPLPPIPGAPRVPFTTPQQERNRYSSYELMDKLRRLEKQQTDTDCKTKRHSVPILKKQQHITTPNEVPGVRRYNLDSKVKRERIMARRASIEEKLEKPEI